jgi:hypothetical protein
MLHGGVGLQGLCGRLSEIMPRSEKVVSTEFYIKSPWSPKQGADAAELHFCDCVYKSAQGICFALTLCVGAESARHVRSHHHRPGFRVVIANFFNVPTHRSPSDSFQCSFKLHCVHRAQPSWYAIPPFYSIQLAIGLSKQRNGPVARTTVLRYSTAKATVCIQLHPLY